MRGEDKTRGAASGERRYRVLQIHNFYQIPGGEDVVVRNEKRLLSEHGHEVYTYYRSNGELEGRGPLWKLLLPFTAVFSLKTYREVRRIIRANDIDIVHVHNTLTMVSPSVFYAAFSCGVPVVQTLHNFRMLCPAGSFFRDNVICEECVEKGMLCAVRHKCYRGSALQTMVSAAILTIHRLLGTYRRVSFICLTQFNCDKLLDASGKRAGGRAGGDSPPGAGQGGSRRQIVSPDRVYIKPNFTFAENIQPEEDLEGEDYFLFAGRLEALKGIDVAVEAFSMLPEKRLLVAGDGPMMAEMQSLVRERGMENVTFLGYLQKGEMQERFRHARAVIMTSQCYEAFAMTIAEAYSYGVPVIAGRIGNMDGMVQEGVTGIKFTYNSSEDLARKVREFDKMDIRALKLNARAFYESRLRPEDNYKKLVEIYRDVTEANTSKRRQNVK